MKESEMLKFIVCPNCKCKLTPDVKKKKFTCERCKLRFTWPNLLIDDAEKVYERKISRIST